MYLSLLATAALHSVGLFSNNSYEVILFLARFRHVGVRTSTMQVLLGPSANLFSHLLQMQLSTAAELRGVLRKQVRILNGAVCIGLPACRL